MSLQIEIAEILQFWFGDHTDDAAVASHKAELWWAKDAATDTQVHGRFAEVVEQAMAGALESWLQSPRGALAAIILCDQFTRMIYRDTPRAFAADPLARRWCEQGLKHGLDRSLRPIERVFFYLPLEHSENLAHQERSVELFTELLDSVPDAHRETFATYLDFAIRHRNIIARFGRFPHRNSFLGRTSTAAEEEFLKQPGSSF